MIRFRCGCGKSLLVHEAHAGRRVKCPGCGAVRTAPEPEPAAANRQAPTRGREPAQGTPDGSHDDASARPRRRNGTPTPRGESGRSSHLLASGLTLQERKQYKGVRGWLLLFCIALVFLYPIGTIVLGYIEYSSRSDLLDAQLKSRDWRSGFYMEFAVMCGLAAFAVYAGISLWQVRPGAVSLARWFLVANILGSAAAHFLWLSCVHSLGFEDTKRF